jgi:hypothetical protein
MSTTRQFPGFEHLYKVYGPLDDEKSFFAGLESIDIDEVALERGEWVPTQPVTAKWSFGPPIPGDIVGGGFVGIYFVSARISRLLEKHAFSGWSTYPVLLLDGAGRKCDGFVGLSITGRCGPIDETKGVLIKPHPEFPEYRGTYFDASTWDGSDFFMPIDGGGTFVTEPVKEMFENHHVSGPKLGFTRLTEATWIDVIEDVDAKKEDDDFLESLYMDRELDPAGFVVPKGDPPAPEVPIEYFVLYPFDNANGHKWRTCETFDEAKAFVLYQQERGVEDAVILRSHQLIWAMPAKKRG